MYKAFFAEDEAAVRDLIIQTIDWKEQGIEFCGTAGDGEKALPMILKEKPDILITDIKMPDMDGLELSRLVRQSLPNIQIVIISGYSDFNFMREAIHLGVTDYVLKPVTPLKLIQALGRAIRVLDAEEDSERTRSLMNGHDNEFRTEPDLSNMLDDVLESRIDEEALSDFLNTRSEADIAGYVKKMLEKRRELVRTDHGMNVFFIYDVIAAVAKVSKRMGLEPQFLKEYAGAAQRCMDDEGLAGLLTELFRRAIGMREAMSDTKTRLVRKAQIYIDGHYMEQELSLSAVAEVVGITPNYLSLLFSKEMNESFSEYLNRIRVRKAAGLLKNSSRSIHEIALQVGYTDSFYFSKVFKKIMGMSPREFRRL